MGQTRVMTSTIDIGRLTIGLFDPATNNLFGVAPRPRHSTSVRIPTRLPHLEKAMAKVFRNYPPGTGKR